MNRFNCYEAVAWTRSCVSTGTKITTRPLGGPPMCFGPTLGVHYRENPRFGPDRSQTTHDPGSRQSLATETASIARIVCGTSRGCYWWLDVRTAKYVSLGQPPERVSVATGAFPDSRAFTRLPIEIPDTVCERVVSDCRSQRSVYQVDVDRRPVDDDIDVASAGAAFVRR